MCMSERLTLVNDLDVSAETGLGGGGEGAEFTLERLELKMDSVDVGPHVGRVVRGVVAAVIRAVVTARQKKNHKNEADQTRRDQNSRSRID